MTIHKAIGPTQVPKPYSIQNLPPLIVGGAVLNTIYTSNPNALPIKSIIEKAFQTGIIAIDTSPYYGASEELIGQALNELKSEWPRESYFICTKAGRIQLDEFDYARDAVRKSVERSLQRLNTTYLDLVYMHDIEFVTEVQVFDALRELKLLKSEGVIKNIGISGYPVEFLYKVALGCAKEHVGDIGPLDAILSYSNGCIQNTILFNYYDKFFNDCGIKKLLNASILSMSLLRSGKTLAFHPASQSLKDAVDDAAHELLSNNNVELADLSTRFALKHWLFDTIGDKPDSDVPSELQWNDRTSIVLGVSTLEELYVGIDSYWQVKTNENGINEKDVALIEQFQGSLGNDHLNETWPSGIDH